MLAAGCGDGDGTVPDSPDAPESLAVTSTAFDQGQSLPAKYTCDGAGVSPPLSWDRPDGTVAAYAVVVDDPDAPDGTYVHWVVVDLPASVTSLGPSASPDRGRETRNSAGETGYTPPCPPSGTHHYRFSVYALSHRLDLDPGTEPDAAVHAITDGARAWGRLTTTYRHRE